MSVGTVAVDSRFTGSIATEHLMAELSTVTVTGTTMTYSDIAISRTEIDISTQINYASLVSIHTETSVSIELIAEMEIALAATFAAQLSKHSLCTSRYYYLFDSHTIWYTRHI